MIQRSLLLFLLVLGNFCVSAQEKDSTLYVSEARQPNPFNYFETFPTMSSESETMKTFSTEVGMSGFTNFDGGYGFNTYIAPTLSYQLSQRWRIDFRGTMGATTAYNMPMYFNPTEASYIEGDLKYNYLGVYGQVIYDITPKLYAGASVFGSQAFNVDMPMNKSMNNLSSAGASMFVGYKFSESFKMEAEISIGQNNNPFGNRFSPYNSYMGTPRSY